MCEADMYRVFTCDWSGDLFRGELGGYLQRKTGYDMRDIEAYLDAENTMDILDPVIGDNDILVTISERAHISVFMVMLLVKSREEFIDELRHSYHVHEDMMYA